MTAWKPCADKVLNARSDGWPEVARSGVMGTKLGASTVCAWVTAGNRKAAGKAIRSDRRFVANSLLGIMPANRPEPRSSHRAPIRPAADDSGAGRAMRRCPAQHQPGREQ